MTSRQNAFVSDAAEVFAEFDARRKHSQQCRKFRNNGDEQELYHSKMICRLLRSDPVLLQSFVGYLKAQAERRRKISVAESMEQVIRGLMVSSDSVQIVTEAIVEDTKRRIDVLIRGGGDEKPWAIIIENKIHFAPDEFHQIPDYVKAVEDGRLKGLKKAPVVAVVYLKAYLEGGLPGDSECWVDCEKRLVIPKLLPIAGYLPGDGVVNSLYGGWLSRSEVNSICSVQDYKRKLYAQAGESVYDDLFRCVAMKMHSHGIYPEELSLLRRLKVCPISSSDYFGWMARRIESGCAAKGFRNKIVRRAKCSFCDLIINKDDIVLRLAVDVHCNQIAKKGISLVVRYGNKIDKPKVMKMLERRFACLGLIYRHHGKHPPRLHDTTLTSRECADDAQVLIRKVQQILDSITECRCEICNSIGECRLLGNVKEG